MRCWKSLVTPIVRSTRNNCKKERTSTGACMSTSRVESLKFKLPTTTTNNKPSTSPATQSSAPYLPT